MAFGFARIAVPFFFLISGFLFFRNLDSNAQLIAKIRRRFLSLVIPYLCWSTLWLIVLGVVTSIESGTDNPIRSLVPDAPLEWLYVWALDPIPGQLWFVRDLIGLSLLSPLLMIGIRWLGFWLPLGINVAWFLVPENVVIEQRAAWEIISISGLAMFTTGAWLAHAGVALDRFPRGFELLGLVWVLIVIVTILNPLSSIEIPNPTARLFLDRLGITCGIMTVWTGYRWFANALNVPIVNEFSRHTFFIFAAQKRDHLI